MQSERMSTRNGVPARRKKYPQDQAYSCVRLAVQAFLEEEQENPPAMENLTAAAAGDPPMQEPGNRSMYKL